MNRYLVTFLIFIFLSTVVFTQEESGKVAVVKNMRGSVTVEHGGVIKKINKGDWLEEGEVVKTEDKSFVQLVFLDKSSISVGPGSELLIEKFSKKEAGLLNLVKGKIRSQVSKDYLEMKGDQKSKLYVKSPGAVMGIRGTDFMFSYSDKTKASSAILFEGSVVFSKIGENEKPTYREMEKFVERDNIRINPGEFSVALRGANSATIPAVLNIKQREVLEKNIDFSAGKDSRNPASVSVGKESAPTKSIVPPGLNGKIVSNDNAELKSNLAKVVGSGDRGPASESHKIGENSAPKEAPPKVSAEGFISANGAIKPANGSLMHIETGTIIAPPENSGFDPQTNSYIPNEQAGTIATSGEYVPPKNIIYKEASGEFVQMTVQNGQTVQTVIKPSDAVMPAQPIAVQVGQYAGDPIVGIAPPPPPTLQNDIYNNQFNPNGLNDFQNNNQNYGYNPAGAQIIKAKVGFDFTVQ